MSATVPASEQHAGLEIIKSGITMVVAVGEQEHQTGPQHVHNTINVLHSYRCPSIPQWVFFFQLLCRFQLVGFFSCQEFSLPVLGRVTVSCEMLTVYIFFICFAYRTLLSVRSLSVSVILCLLFSPLSSRDMKGTKNISFVVTTNYYLANKVYTQQSEQHYI